MNDFRRSPVTGLSLLLTGDCNLRCGYCYRRRSGGRMTWATARRALEWGLSAGSSNLEIVFTGGEPLLAFPLIRRAVEFVRGRTAIARQAAAAARGQRTASGVLASAARSQSSTAGISASTARRQYTAVRRPHFILQTNGMLLDEAALAFLARHRVEVRLSLDGLPAAQDLRLRGSFPMLDALLEQMRTRHPRLYRRDLMISMTALPQTVGRLADSVRYFLDRGVTRIGIAPSLATTGSWRPERITELRDQFREIRRLGLDRYRASADIPVLALRGRPTPPFLRFPDRALCNVGAGTTPAVNANGRVLGCVMLNRKALAAGEPWLARELRRLRIGKITDPDLPSRVSGFRGRAIRSRLLIRKGSKRSAYGRCAECPAIADCLVCPVSIGLQAGNEDPDRIPDFVCAFMRTAWEARRRFQREIARRPADAIA